MIPSENTEEVPHKHLSKREGYDIGCRSMSLFDPCMSLRFSTEMLLVDGHQVTVNNAWVGSVVLIKMVRNK